MKALMFFLSFRVACSASVMRRLGLVSVMPTQSHANFTSVQCRLVHGMSCWHVRSKNERFSVIRKLTDSFYWRIYGHQNIYKKLKKFDPERGNIVFYYLYKRSVFTGYLLFSSSKMTILWTWINQPNFELDRALYISWSWLVPFILNIIYIE